MPIGSLRFPNDPLPCGRTFIENLPRVSPAEATQRKDGLQVPRLRAALAFLPVVDGLCGRADQHTHVCGRKTEALALRTHALGAEPPIASFSNDSTVAAARAVPRVARWASFSSSAKRRFSVAISDR